MTHIWQGSSHGIGPAIRNRLRSGHWLTRARARAYSLILLVLCAIAIIGWIALSDRLIDRNGKPIGTDFSNVYAAGELTWQGRSADAYQPVLQHEAEKAMFGGREVPFFGWHYPPFFFAVAVLVAALPYAWGLALWLIASFAAYLAVISAILPRAETLLIAAAFPAVFVNIGHGQNGFLTAALLGGALQLLDRKPWLAGVLIGLLAYKPQFGVMIPIALLAGGRWRSIAAAVATIAALSRSAAPRLAAGSGMPSPIPRHSRKRSCSNRAAPAGRKSSRHSRRRAMWGADVQTAYAIQIALGLTLAVSVAWLWRSRRRVRTQGRRRLQPPACSQRPMCSITTSSYSPSPSLSSHATASDRGFRDFEISLLAAAWIVPLLSRTMMGVTGIPLGLMVLLALYVFTLRRALLDREAATFGCRARIAQA